MNQIIWNAQEVAYLSPLNLVDYNFILLQALVDCTTMEGMTQEEWVKKLESKLGELREQRIKVDEANEILKKKLET